MKFLYIFLLLIIKKTLCDDSLSSDQKFIASEKCLAEINKYQECLSGLETNDSEENIDFDMKTPAEITKFCSNFDNDKCTEFVADSVKSESACISKDNKNLMDILTGMTFVSLKVVYSTYCAKGSDGKVCPFSQYIIDNFKEFDNLNNNTDLDDAGKKALASDCRDSKCHERFISIKEMADNIESIESITNNADDDNVSTEDSVNISTSILDKYYENYQKNQCSVIDGSSDAFTINKFTFSCITLIIVSCLLLI